MLTLIFALFIFLLLFLAYFTYGSWLSKRLFGLNAHANVPSQELRDDIDFVPTPLSIVFGHHFTSIAGTGPIVGPALAVYWGWLPALVWIVVGSIFIGAVHDLGSLVISLRNRGQTIGDIAGRLINPRAKILFLAILFLALTIVLAIFGMVIANIFNLYPSSVLSSWIILPLAVGFGLYTHRFHGNALFVTILSVSVLYLCVYLGVYHFPIVMPSIPAMGSFGSPVMIWTFILLGYCAVASVLPVWILLQPRDYINSQQLFVALGLVFVGLIVSGLTNQLDLFATTPMLNTSLPADAPPLWPFLFITVACGACSGFHCLVSSGTSSKQLAKETDAKIVGYGSMLLEGGLAVIVILLCTAGVGMGISHSQTGELLTGSAAWQQFYPPAGAYAQFGFKQQLNAFIQGGSNILFVIGIDKPLGAGLIAVLVATFAATTMDSATRLQRYVIQELAASLRLPVFRGKYDATLLAVCLGGVVAMLPAPGNVPGTGGLILWPLFGATNQLLAGLALVVIVFYLRRRNLPLWLIAIPTIFMLVIPGWGMVELLRKDVLSTESLYPVWQQNVLLGFGAGILILQFWMIVEAGLLWGRVKGIVESPLPPLPKTMTSSLSSPLGDA